MIPKYGEQITYARALALKRANEEDKWPKRGEDSRLEPEAWPRTTPRFMFKPGQKIFTIGSCFARNIEEHLQQAGFDIPTLRFACPPGESPARPNSILNKYTPAAIVQEIRWSRRILDRDKQVRWEDVEPLVIETSPGMYLDMQLDTVASVPKERTLERRAQIFEIYRSGLEADVMVITPGLIEAWLDSVTGMFVSRMPSPQLAAQLGAGRYRFQLLTYEQCYEHLTLAMDMLDPGRRKPILMTVSPVPIQRTFTDQDIIVANQYSKSLLRAVVGRIYAERENCDYFPSYESVMLSKRPEVWDDDLVHVTDSFVNKIVRRLVESRMAVAPVAASAAHALERFSDSMQRRDFESAWTAYGELGALAMSVQVPAFHREAARLLGWRKEFRAALQHAERLVELRHGNCAALISLAIAQQGCGDASAARRTAQKARDMARIPKHIELVEALLRDLSAEQSP